MLLGPWLVNSIWLMIVEQDARGMLLSMAEKASAAVLKWKILLQGMLALMTTLKG